MPLKPGESCSTSAEISKSDHQEIGLSSLSLNECKFLDSTHKHNLFSCENFIIKNDSMIKLRYPVIQAYNTHAHL